MNYLQKSEDKRFIKSILCTDRAFVVLKLIHFSAAAVAQKTNSNNTEWLKPTKKEKQMN